MPAPVSNVTTAVLQLALDAAAMRQSAHVQNLANISTPGYRPLQVDFESRLDGARRSLARQGTVDAASLSGSNPQFVQIDRQTAPELDAESLRMAGNAVHFQALLRGVSRHLGVLGLAAADGKR